MIGLNFADLFACLGLYSATPTGAFVPGLECAGVVEATGSGEPRRRGIAPGDRVIGLTRFGAYAHLINLDVRYLWPLPPGWSFAEAAAFPVQGLTAWYGVSRTRGAGTRRRGARALGGGGGGSERAPDPQAQARESSRRSGVPAKRDFLREHCGLGPAQVIVRDRRGFGAQLDHALAALDVDGLDLVLDAIAGPFFRPAYERLRPEGRLVLYGAADLMPRRARPDYLRLALKYLRRPRLDPLRMIAENKSVMAFNLIWLWDRVDRLPRAYEGVSRLARRPPFVGRRFRFAEAPAALRYLQSGESIGKVVLEV